MFGKISKAKFADILYDTILSETNLLGKKIKENELSKEKLYIDRTTFTFLSFAFHMRLYNDIFVYKYDPRLVMDVMLLCIDELVKHPTSNQAYEKKESFKEMYGQISTAISQATGDAEAKHEDIFIAFAAVVVSAMFGDQVEVLTDEDDESLEELGSCIANHFRQIANDKRLINLNVRM